MEDLRIFTPFFGATLSANTIHKTMKSFFIGLIGILSVIYLINPTLGVFELFPDNLPIVGNLDEAAATTLLLSALSYFGIDLHNFFKRKNEKSKIK